MGRVGKDKLKGGKMSSVTEVKTDVILLTGAGASAPLGLKTMEDFMELLDDKFRIKYPLLGWLEKDER